MAAANHVFHVEFGFNDTELTRALENQQWAKAERLIVDNSQSSYLDEGCGQRIPLYIVLCGEAEDTLRVTPRNLHIARLLVQHGANVNFRVPESFMSEYLGPGQSALELVVNFYNDVTSTSGGNQQSWEPSSEIVIGFDNKPETDHEDLVELLCDMVFIMLGHGGDSNLLNKERETLLHRTVAHSNDPHLCQVLCENGAHVNAVDVLGNTPLLAFCAREREEDGAEIGSNWHERFMEHMLAQKEIQVNITNKHGCTALFCSMLEGQVGSARQLLGHGCDPTARATIMHTKKELINQYNIRPFSPLFAALCFPGYLSSMPDVDIDTLWKQPVVTNHFAHLVDAGYFNKLPILMELHTYLMGEPIMRHLPEAFLLDNDRINFTRLGSLGMALVGLMFGATTSSLKQLCARHLFRKHFLQTDERPISIISPDESHGSSCDVSERPDVDESFQLDRADDDVLCDFLHRFGLPHDLLLNFTVELFRQKLGSQLMYYAQMHYEVLSGSETDSLPSEENDSDLEYW